MINDEYSAKAKELLGRMTLEEKALLLTGDGWWATHRIDRLGIPSISLTDGPHGVRKGQGAGLVTSVPATCFPTASALSCSWDLDLLRRVGVALPSRIGRAFPENATFDVDNHHVRISTSAL